MPRMQSRRRKGVGGFTLIEILIVISIIAILASMILGAVSLARKKTSESLARSTVSTLNTQLESYVQDTGRFPGTLQEGYRDGDNAFPALFEALFGLRPPQGAGGPSSPYGKVREADVVVEDDAEEGGYRQATSDEMYDQKVKKFMLDPWGQVYIYHENKTRPRRDYMHDRNADIYSTGPNREDDTSNGEAGDDIGSW